MQPRLLGQLVVGCGYPRKRRILVISKTELLGAMMYFPTNAFLETLGKLGVLLLSGKLYSLVRAKLYSLGKNDSQPPQVLIPVHFHHAFLESKQRPSISQGWNPNPNGFSCLCLFISSRSPSKDDPYFKDSPRSPKFGKNLDFLRVVTNSFLKKSRYLKWFPKKNEFYKWYFQGEKVWNSLFRR